MKRSGFKERGKPLERKTPIWAMSGALQGQRTKLRQRAKKPKAQPKSATGPMREPWRVDLIKAMDCIACGCSGPSDIHHSKDRPPFDLKVYRYFPGHGEISADADGIPLCRPCHRMFHTDHGEFTRRFGKDYEYIPLIRAECEHVELDF